MVNSYFVIESFAHDLHSRMGASRAVRGYMNHQLMPQLTNAAIMPQLTN